MIKSSSTRSSVLYNRRKAIGTQILLELYQKNLIDLEHTDPVLQNMISVLFKTRKGKKKKATREEAALMAMIPPRESDIPCPQEAIDLLLNRHDRLLSDSFVSIHKLSDGSWTYCRAL